MWKISLKKIRGTITSHIRSWSWWIQVENLTRIHIYIQTYCSSSLWDLNKTFSSVFFLLLVFLYTCYIHISTNPTHDIAPIAHSTPLNNITLSLLHKKSTQQGLVGVGGRCAGPRVDLPLHCYLLLRHKGTPGRAAPGRKARQRMSQLKLHREEEPHLSSMTTLSPMNTIYATGSLFSNRPPLVPSSLPHALPTITGTLLVFCVLPHLFPPLFLIG